MSIEILLGIEDEWISIQIIHLIPNLDFAKTSEPRNHHVIIDSSFNILKKSIYVNIDEKIQT